MRRAVFDVNVLVSGFVSPVATPRQLIRLWQVSQITLVTSEHILDGVSRAWRNDYFRSRISVGEADEALRVLRKEAVVIAPSHAPRGVAADEEDDLVLGTALAGMVDVLVTGDRFLLKLESYEGIRILNPRDYLELLSSG